MLKYILYNINCHTGEKRIKGTKYDIIELFI